MTSSTLLTSIVVHYSVVGVKAPATVCNTNNHGSCSGVPERKPPPPSRDSRSSSVIDGRSRQVCDTQWRPIGRAGEDAATRRHDSLGSPSRRKSYADDSADEFSDDYCAEHNDARAIISANVRRRARGCYRADVRLAIRCRENGLER